MFLWPATKKIHGAGTVQASAHLLDGDGCLHRILGQAPRLRKRRTRPMLFTAPQFFNGRHSEVAAGWSSGPRQAMSKPLSCRI